MARDLRLRAADHLDEIADAELLVTHQVQNPESRFVPKRLKEPFEVKLGFLGHAYIFALTYPLVKHIFFLADMIFAGGIDV